jgi:CheY-like chemotaxis protein
MENKELLKISDLAEIAKVMPSTIRHYTDLGLLKVAGYTDGGHRLYAKTECLERLNKIQALSKRGVTLPQIKGELESKSKVKKVLVVDDEQEAVDVMTEVLKLKFPNWKVQVAMDGFTAGRLLPEFYPDLVILDLMLPGIDGFKICQLIRADSMLSGVKILAITGYDTDEIRQKIMTCGANDYLAKPLDMKSLIEKIQKLAE